ncbi:MAG TPA: class I SAM-dependent methyltransferase [Steroidobacter sp.]|uniref:class I SAM-dependent methyltransferase n=1 Tax=Steroidobacter sp. TaxID=1978227 RepID=UPI002EDB8BCA
MSNSGKANQDQVELWNEASGRTWVEMQAVLDGILAPFASKVIDAGFPGEGGRVLDIGCGAGMTTRAMAQRLGPRGHCVGVDISEPLLTAARARAAADRVGNASFLQADAQTHAFEPGSADAIISRFGVMFFDDPEGAFANLRRAVRPSGQLAFVAWRSPAENPFMTAAKRAAEPLLPNMPCAAANAPGQFAFADGDRVRRILERAGWSDIAVRPVDAEGNVAEKDLFAYVTKLGPVGVALRDVQDAALQARVAEALRAAFQTYIRDGAAHFTMACWLVTAVRRE